MEHTEVKFGDVRRAAPPPSVPVATDFHNLQQQARDVNTRLETALTQVESLIARIYGEGETSEQALKAHPHAAGALGELYDCLNRAEANLERMERKLDRLSQLA
jgi:hypothetical protein